MDTTVDVHYGGLRIGVFRAVFTPGSIAFSNPEEMVSKVPSLNPQSVALVARALSGDLPTHADLLCRSAAAAGCGQLRPEIAGVIFDEERFRAELFVHPAHLSEQDTHTEKVLPPAPDIVSGVHSLSGGMLGSPGEPHSYSVLTNSTLAYGDTRMNFTGITASERSAFQNLSASMDRWGLESKVGFFDSRPLQLLAQTPMTGVSVGTSLDTNLAYRNTTGSRLSVFLPQRAYVSLIFNNVIYSTDFYEAGNQVLNTEILPDGAYEVTIRIVDTDGKQTEEKRFFSKNFQVPPEGQPIYFGQLGTVRDTAQAGFLPDAGSGLISSFGVLSRYGESTGVALDSLVIKNRLYAEAGSFVLLPPDHQLRASLLVSSGRDFGVGGTYQGFALDKKLAFGANIRTIFAGETYRGSDQLIPVKADARQMTANAGYQLSDLANVNFLLDYSQAGAGQERLSYGPSLRWDLWRDGESNLSLGLDASQSNDGHVQNVMIRYTKRLGAWGLSGEATARRGGQAGGASTALARNARLTWNDDATPGILTIAGAEMRQDGHSDNYLADLDHRSQLGNLKLLGSQTRSPQARRTVYSGNMGFGIAHTLEDIAWNGAQQQSSGVVIKTHGNAPETPMKVIVDGSERSQFLTGGSTALFLAPYQSYKISISPVESAPIDYDGSVKHITLYPGNVMPLLWEMSVVHVVLGRVVTEDGEPVAQARLEESGNLVATDEDGLFQTELKKLDRITFYRPAQERSLQKAPAKPAGGRPDLFTVMPPDMPAARRSTAPLTDPEKQALILELFGDVGDVSAPPPAAEPVPAGGAAPPASPAPQQTAPEAPLPALRPAFRCRVELPEAKEVNHVIMYAEPLVCRPIPLEDAAKEEPDAADEAAEAEPENAAAAEAEPDGGEAASGAAGLPEEGAAHLSPPSGGAERIQLGAYRSQAQAFETWKRLEALSPVFAAITPRVEIVDIPDKGRFHRLRIGGFASQAASAAFCRGVIALGRECFVVQRGNTAGRRAKPAAKNADGLAVPDLDGLALEDEVLALPPPAAPQGPDSASVHGDQ